jgi:hypothetical protein
MSKKTTCQRCGSDLSAGGYCTDETCPFREHKQDCEAGWSGHPERDPHPLDDDRPVPCTCGSLGEFGTEEDCPVSLTAKHEPDPSSINSADDAGTGRGTDWLVDVSCKHCGRSGTARINPDQVDW